MVGKLQASHWGWEDTCEDVAVAIAEERANSSEAFVQPCIRIHASGHTRTLPATLQNQKQHSEGTWMWLTLEPAIQAPQPKLHSVTRYLLH